MRYLFCLMFCYLTLDIKANNTDTIINNDNTKHKVFSISPSLTVTNLHVWRSFATGTAPCIEPNINWKYKNLSLDTWAAYAVDNSYKEIDFILTYSWNFLSIILSDYYCPLVDKKEAFTNLKNSETDHIFEIKTDLTISRKVPITLSGAVFFAGNDVEKNGTEVKQLYSSYFEASYPVDIANTTILLEVGMTPAKGLYADEAKIFNYGLTAFKDIRINEQFTIPTSYKLVYNSDKNILHFSLGFTIR